MSSSNHTTIPTKPETADRVYEYKGRGETWDDAVNRLLKMAERN